MAVITYVSTSNRYGAQAVQAIEQIRHGLGVLKELDGLRAESIGASQETMAANFGVSDNSQAQAFSDRWSALLAAFEDSGNTEFAKLRDFINATAWAV